MSYLYKPIGGNEMKNKKLFGLILSLGILSSVIIPTGQAIVTKAEELDPADQSFIEFLLSDINYETEIEYTHSPLYNEDLEVNGRQYDFTVGDIEGYALLTEIQGVSKTFYEVEELFYNKQSPFDDCEGLPVYITHGLYLDYKDNEFYNILDNNQVSEEVVEACAYKGFRYCGMGDIVTQTQTVNYTTKSTSTYSIQYDLPNYLGQEGVADCANVAGAVIIGYYDRFYENLIPNFQAYTRLGSVLRYKTSATEVYELVSELSSLMGTQYAGTTFAEFQDGMAQYVSGKGYTYSTTNVFSSGYFDFNKYKNAVESNKPVALFLNTFAMLNGITENGTSDTISNGYINSTHVVVGCGYRCDTYYDGNGAQKDVRRYLKVASGTSSYNIGYLNINGLGQIDRAISVTIG